MAYQDYYNLYEPMECMGLNDQMRGIYNNVSVLNSLNGLKNMWMVASDAQQMYNSTTKKALQMDIACTIDTLVLGYCIVYGYFGTHGSSTENQILIKNDTLGTLIAESNGFAVYYHANAVYIPFMANVQKGDNSIAVYITVKDGEFILKTNNIKLILTGAGVTKK